MEAEIQDFDGEDAKLLIVDDEIYDLEILKAIFSARGYRVQAARDGRTALQLVAARPPHLILLDVRLPGEDGYEICRQLKAADATREIPVIFISGDDDVSAKVEAFRCGGVDYVTKPFHQEEILARVSTHLNLRGLQQQLEERVRQRSSVLAVANARLQREIADRRQAEERFRSMLEAAPDAMVMVNERRQIVQVNCQVEVLFGYQRDELLGQPVEMLMPERYRQSHAATGDGYIASPRTRAMGTVAQELCGLRKDGSEFPVEISLSPLYSSGSRLVISAIRDVSVRKRSELELLEFQQRLRDLATHRDTVREEERKRIAGEIHDELGSLLTALKMDISLLRMQLGGNSEALGRLNQMRELVEHTIRMVRHVATQLRPAALNLGLVPALEWLLEDFQRHSEVACYLQGAPEVAMDDALATAVFRIVQESLTNVARHSSATRVDVTLACGDGYMDLAVADNGEGFDPALVGQGTFGLLGIKERASILGGEAKVDSAPGQGCRLSIRIPLPTLEVAS